MNISLREAFGITDGDIVSVVGAGGKTTLMFALAREIASVGKHVISTTTTKILEPSSSQTPLLIVESDAERLIKSVTLNIERFNHITVASRRLKGGKLKGISTNTIARLAALKKLSNIFIEADGAAGRPLKAPNSTEPVISPNTSLVIPVAGIDALGCPLTNEYVFRHEIASALLGLPEGWIITAGHIATLITHTKGMAKGTPDGARIVPFVNKADIEGGVAKGRMLAKAILSKRHPQIDRVILGQAKLPEPIFEIIRY